jgi:CheY-like chemotaxis protein
MGGDVGVESEPGVGTTFWFTATLGRGAEQIASSAVPDEAQHRLRRDHRGARVLVVEDNLINQEVLLELLKATGLVVDVASNGLQAVAMARSSGYDAILMDIQMPELDGFAATREIRELPGHAETPILALTANAFAEDRAASLAAGMNDHLAKPVEPQRLYAMLLRWLSPRLLLAAPATAVAPQATALPAGTDLGLAGIAGFDAELGLKLVGGRGEAFLRLIRQFARSYRGGVADVLTDLAAGRYASARMRAHALKGACGVVGATRIASLAAALEAAIVGEAPAEQLLSAASNLDVELAALATQIAMRLPAPDESLAMPADKRQAEALVERLAALVEAGDFSADEAWREAAPLIRAVAGDEARQLESLLLQCDYPGALAVLHKIRGALQSAPPKGDG